MCGMQFARSVCATGHTSRLPKASHFVGVARLCSTLLAVLVSFCWLHIIPCPVGLHVSRRIAAVFGVLHPMSQSFSVDAEGLFAFRFLRCFAWRCFSQALSKGLSELWLSDFAKNKSSCDVFELSQSASAFGAWCPSVVLAGHRFVWLATPACSSLVSSPSGRPDVQLPTPAHGRGCVFGHLSAALGPHPLLTR